MSDYETTQKRRNITVGVFVIIALCSLVWMVYKFEDLPTTISELGSFEVFVQFPTARGVQENTPVYFCGYQIGRVTKVMAPEPLEDMWTGLVYHQTKVILHIDKKYINIPSSVEVRLMTRGLGSSYVELKIDPTKPETPLDPNRPETKFLVDKMLLQGATGMTSEFFPEESQKKLDDLITNLCTLIDNANDVFGNKANKENLSTALANLSKASEKSTQALNEFQGFFAAARGTTEELSKTITELRLILEKINSGEGTAARLVNDGRFYESLLENTEQMQVLLEEIRLLIAQSRKEGVPIKLK